MDGIDLNDIIHKVFFAVTCDKHLIIKSKDQILYDSSINSLWGITDNLSLKGTDLSIDINIMSRLKPFLIK